MLHFPLPVFVSGFNKSGTTLLLAMLDNHPELIVFPEELHFLKNVLFSKDPLNAVTSSTGFRMFIDDTYLSGWSKGKSWFQDGYPDFPKDEFARRVREVARIKQHPKDLLVNLVRAFAEVSNSSFLGKRGWVTKTTQNEIYVPIIQQLFGNGFVFFYVVRDPRDVYLSYAKRVSFLEGQKSIKKDFLINFAVNWRLQVSHALRYERDLPNFHLVRYEDIIGNGCELMRRLSGQIGISYDEDVTSLPTRLGKPWGGNSVFQDAFSGLSRRPVGRYRTMLDPPTKNIIESASSKEMGYLGYQCSGSDWDCSSQGPVHSRFQVIYLFSKLKYICKREYFLAKYKRLGYS